MPVYNCPTIRFALLLWMVTLLSEQSMAAETFTAFLTDGRSVTGIVDARTDHHHLWLRREEASFDLASGFPWDQVMEGQVGDQRLSPDEIRLWSEERKVPGRRFLALNSGAFEERQRTTSQPSSAATIEPVKTLVIQAYLAQWDDDAQPDGLRVFVWPLDAHGRIAPVDGQIEFTLVIEREKLNGSRSALRPEFRELDRISHLVRREHFASGPAVYELPFSKRHSDFDANIAHHSLLHARLGVPGRGVFEASDVQVGLRETSR